MSDNIPFDIQMEIIKRVPDVKSLIRFRAVSKQWKSFIDSSEFIACYGARRSQPHHLLLRYEESIEVKYLSFLDDVSFPHQQQDFAPNVPLLIKQLIYSEVIGSSCGLWCLHDYSSLETEEMVVIWNPSIRKSVCIVVPCVLKYCPSQKMTHYGFGVCPSTYDPNIVIMSHSHVCLEKKDMDMWQVGIFTLSSKTWKMIPTSNVPCQSIRLKSSTQVAIDRFIFWVAYDDGVSQYKSLIMSFDLISQEFKQVNLPVSILNPSDISISKLNESLVVSAYTVDVNGLVHGVWMMGEEGDVMTSFTKLFNIKTHDESVSRVLGFTMSGEPIMETQFRWYNTVEIYKPCSEQINDLGINGDCGSFFIYPYTETLLLVDHLDCCIISNDS
ncbi:F-box protein-like protein [Tanacetum coccineum]